MQYQICKFCACEIFDTLKGSFEERDGNRTGIGSRTRNEWTEQTSDSTQLAVKQFFEVPNVSNWDVLRLSVELQTVRLAVSPRVLNQEVLLKKFIYSIGENREKLKRSK